MIELVTIGLIIAMAMLWKRLRRAEERIAALNARLGAGNIPAEVAPRPMIATPQHVAQPAPPPVEPEPAEPSVSERVTPEPAGPGLIARARETVFEELFGSRLPIWAGGVTLAVAGVFLVKYSIDTGLLSPLLRVTLGLFFGLGLIAGAEVARHFSARVRDPRVAQALAGAGVACCYAAILIATNLYALVGPLTAFIGLAGVTAGAIALALRFGAPSAVLGLVGGLSAPALVGGPESSTPALALYLMLVIAALAGVARRQGWLWLSAAALLGGFGWGAVLIATSTLDFATSGAIGVLLLALAFAVPALGFGTTVADRAPERATRLFTIGAAAIQLALLVVQGDFGALEWGFYGLLAIGAVALARIDAGQRLMPAVALAVALATIAFWPEPDPRMLAAVAGGLLAILCAPALIDAWHPVRGRIATAQGVAALIGAVAVGWMRFPEMLSDAGWAAMSAAFSLAAAFAAAQEYRGQGPDGSAADLTADWRFALLTTASAALAAIAAAFALPGDALPAAYATGALLVALAPRRYPRLGLVEPALLFAGLAVLTALPRLAAWAIGVSPVVVGEPAFVTALPSPRDALLTIALPGLILAGTALVRSWRPPLRSAILASGAVMIAVAAHVLFKQIFSISTSEQAIAQGMAERVLLTGALFALSAAAIWRQDRLPMLRPIGLVLGGIALARLAWFDLLVFNPLVVEQAVGGWPIVNLLIPAYGLPIAWLALVARREPALAKTLRHPATALAMLLVLMLTATGIRQAFHGSILTVPGVPPAEDIVRSLAGIALALGFLRYGIWHGGKPWRIAALALMLATVTKVFLFDAAGLEGLLRIASFVALGFSLIGIGWLYNRYLQTPPR